MDRHRLIFLGCAFVLILANGFVWYVAADNSKETASEQDISTDQFSDQTDDKFEYLSSAENLSDSEYKKLSGEEVYENEWLNFRIRLATADESYGNNWRLFVEYNIKHWDENRDKPGFNRNDPTKSIFTLQFRDDSDKLNEHTRTIAVAMPADFTPAPQGPWFMHSTAAFANLSLEEMCTRFSNNPEFRSCEVRVNPYGVRYLEVIGESGDNALSLLDGGGYLVPLRGAEDPDWKLIGFYRDGEPGDTQAIIDSFEYIR